MKVGNSVDGTRVQPRAELDGSGMKIAKVEMIALRYEPPEVRWDAHLRLTTRETLLVRLVTSDGIVGIGEAAVFGGALLAVASVVREQLAPTLLGSDPLLREALWHRMYDSTVHLGRAGITMAAISGVDIALWDIAGKVAGLPVFRLLGGMRNEIEAYASGGFYRADGSTAALTDEVVSYREPRFYCSKNEGGRLESAARIIAGWPRCEKRSVTTSV